jgi:hypothetical protein
MNRRRIFNVFLTVMFFNVFAQKNWYHYNWDTSDFLKYKDLYKEIYEYDCKKYKDHPGLPNPKQFSRDCAIDVKEDFDFGSLYPSLMGYENYIKKILDLIVKDTAITSHVRIFFSRNSEYNASMNESGIMRINIGAIARMTTEAELAVLLGHEIAHSINEDMVTRYGRYQEIKNQAQEVAVAGFWTVWYENPWEYYYLFSREQEAKADLIALDYIQKSPYSLKSASNELRQLKRTEIRGEIKYGKRNKSYNTHPDPGDRLKLVQSFSSDSVNKGRKNFIVDSLSFMRLKELCFQETINTCFAQNHLREIMTLTFTRYLLEPDNDENLAMLTESLRRYLVLAGKENLGDKPFILSQYQTEYINKSENYSFLKEKSPSILKYLNKGFVDIWKEDIYKIKAKDLSDTLKIEFTTYKEAYRYFKTKLKEKNNLALQHYKYFGDSANFSDVNEFITNNTIFRSNNYLLTKGNLPPSDKNLYIILPLISGEVAVTNKILDMSTADAINGDIARTFRDQIDTGIYYYENLSVSEKHIVWSMYAFTCNYLDVMDKNHLVTKWFNWSDAMPEWYTFFKNHNVGSIYIFKATPYQYGRGYKQVIRCVKLSLPHKYKHTLAARQKIERFMGYDRWAFKNLSNEFYRFCKETNGIR